MENILSSFFINKEEMLDKKRGGLPNDFKKQKIDDSI